MKERRQRKSRLDPEQAEWEIIGGDSPISDEAANAIADLLLSVADENMARESESSEFKAASLSSVREKKSMTCPFCDLEPDKIILENEVGVALRDAFPVTEGHTLVVPKQHVVSLFELTAKEQASLWQLAAEVRAKLVEEFHPAGFNVGVNDGRAAGQTVMHAHIHIIPRYTGDATDPRGGVRQIIPKKAKYWEDA